MKFFSAINLLFFGFAWLISPCLLIVGQVNAQATYTKKYSPYIGRATCIQHLEDSSFVITGGGSNGAYIIKLNEGGMVEWARSYGDVTESQFNWIEQTSDKGYIATGYRRETGSADQGIFVLKIDSELNVEWSKDYIESYEDNSGITVHQLPDKGYILAGNHTEFDYVRHMFFMRTDSSGDILWDKEFGEQFSGQFDVYEMLPASDDGFIFLGYVGYLSVGKLDNAGNLMWHKEYATTGHPWGFLQKPYGGYYIGNNFGSSFYLISIDEQANVISSTEIIASTYELFPHSLYYAFDGTLIIAGNTHDSSDIYQPFLLNIDTSGNILWSKTYPTFNCNGSVSSIKAIAGSLIILGNTCYDLNTGDEVTLTNVDINGNPFCSDSDLQLSTLPLSIANETRSYYEYYGPSLYNYSTSSVELSVQDSVVCGFPTSSPSITSDEKISLFPNPNFGAFQLSINLTKNLNDVASIKITNAISQVIHKEKVDVVNGRLSKEISLKKFAQDGLYIINLQVNDLTISQRFIIQH